MNGSTQDRQIRVLIADDHPVVLEGLALLLKPARNIIIAGFARSADEVIQKAKTLQPDVVILDVIMPGSPAAQNIKALTALSPAPRIICCSSVSQRDQITGLINAGIKGFIMKSTNADELRVAIETAVSGGQYFAKEVTDIIIESIRTEPIHKEEVPANKDLFNDKEIKIIKLICEEKSVKEISVETNINARTVESIKVRIMKKMDVRNIAGIVCYALRNNYVRIDDLHVSA